MSARPKGIVSMGASTFRVQAAAQIAQLPGGQGSVIAQASMLALGGEAEQAEALLLDKAQPEDAVAMYLAAGEHLAAIRCTPPPQPSAAGRMLRLTWSLPGGLLETHL